MLNRAELVSKYLKCTKTLKARSSMHYYMNRRDLIWLNLSSAIIDHFETNDNCLGLHVTIELVE